MAPRPAPEVDITPPDWFPLRWQLADAAPMGLQGRSPLPWWCGAWYRGVLREQLLLARRGSGALPALEPLAALVGALHTAGQTGEPQPWLLVPIPCRSGSANALPAQLARGLAEKLGWPLETELLQRSRWRRPQRCLGHRQRWRNQWHSFRALLNASPEALQQPVLLVDDVLTSGATAVAAQRALQSAGWQVAGVACLARTPRSRRTRGGA